MTQVTVPWHDGTKRSVKQDSIIMIRATHETGTYHYPVRVTPKGFTLYDFVTMSMADISWDEFDAVVLDLFEHAPAPNIEVEPLTNEIGSIIIRESLDSDDPKWNAKLMSNGYWFASTGATYTEVQMQTFLKNTKGKFTFKMHGPAKPIEIK